MRYSSKAALQADIRAEHDRFVALLEAIPHTRYEEPGVWGDNWSITDVVAHLAEWQALFLGWYDTGRAGREVHLPALGYKWNETPRLNRAIQAKHLGRSHREVRSQFEKGYKRICRLVDAATEAELLAPGYFDWTGRHALTTYLGANTASHYRFACKVIQRWQRVQSSSASRRRRPAARRS